MNSQTYQFTLASSCFAHGAYQTQNFNRPELRAPSVKGMIRWWHEALGHTKADTLAIFGSVANKREGTTNQASSVTIRVQALDDPSIGGQDFMPHKGAQGGRKDAIQAGSPYRLTLTERRGGLNDAQRQQLERATKAWLLLGSIGQRSNRAAGSILWDQCPSDQKTFEIEASTLLSGSQISFAILSNSFGSELEARSLAGDFLADQAFGGTAPFGTAGGFDRASNRRIDRKPSPLKLKCVKLEDHIKLLAVWDHRTESPDNLTKGIATMIESNKQLGPLLEEVLPQLTS